MKIGPEIKILRRTGTHADVFLIAGLADLLSQVMDTPVTINGESTGFTVRFSDVLTEKELGRIAPVPGYPYLKVKGKEIPKSVTDVVDYEAEKMKFERIKKAGKKGKKGLDVETQEQMQSEKPRGDWRHLQVLNTLKGLDTTNTLHKQIMSLSPADFKKDLLSGLEALATGKPSSLKWKVSSVQLFNPVAAKGYSRLKPDSTGRNDHTKEEWSDPIIEWLKYRGYFKVACPFFQNEGKDIRLYTPEPGNISIRALGEISSKFLKSGYFGNSPKLDALAVLGLARIIIDNSDMRRHADTSTDGIAPLTLKGKNPADIISGVEITHYQSVGSAKIVSTMFDLSLPGWFPINSHEDADIWMDILNEHQRVIRGLNDDHSDEITLALDYRRFLERRGESATWALVEFMGKYGAFIMRANGSEHGRRWITRFTDEYFRRILMGTNGKLLDILNDKGFEAVARAVRRSTVSAQNRKAREKSGGQKEWRDIHYEVLPDINRTRKVPGNAFIETVAKFIVSYNSENVRHREVTGDMRSAPANVSDDEFKSFVKLIDEFGAEIVGALLAAYGSCKENREPDDSQ